MSGSQRHVEFADNVDTDIHAFANQLPLVPSPLPKILVRAPTLPADVLASNDAELDIADERRGRSGSVASHTSNSKVTRADAEGPDAPSESLDFGHNDECNDSSGGVVTPDSARSRSTSGSPGHHGIRGGENAFLGVGDNFKTRDGETSGGNAANEDEKDELLEDVGAGNHSRDQQPSNVAISAIRGGGVGGDDIKNARFKSEPPPSEAITDRGEGAWNASERKSQVLTDVSPSDDSSGEKCFADRLEDAMIHPSGRLNKGFMPRGRLEILVNVDAVERELGRSSYTPETNGRSIRSWAEEICGHPNSAETQPSRTYRKIFALLVQLDKLDAIFDFIHEGVSDQDLPLKQYTSSVDGQSSPFTFRRKNDPTRPIYCLATWRFHMIKTFFGDQWAMLSPFFAQGEHKNVRHYQLEEDDILPFTYDSRDESASGGQSVLERGGFGEVFKVRIHRDHHSFDKNVQYPQERDFAVKRLYSTNEDEWKSEIEILKRFSSNTHPHLISLLATYEKGGSAHLIFYWADADLQKYWEARNPHPLMKSTARWVARQCHGIASGIVAIHQHVTTPKKLDDAEDRKHDNLYGRHGDIKPRNILWFKDANDLDGMGALVITDFGIAEMNSKNSRSRKSNRNMKFSRTYCAPETHIPKGEISRSYDIWTLGCLYLECLTWLLGGWPLVKSFARRRTKAEKALPAEGSTWTGSSSLRRTETIKLLGQRSSRRSQSSSPNFTHTKHAQTSSTTFSSLFRRSFSSSREQVNKGGTALPANSSAQSSVEWKRKP